MSDDLLENLYQDWKQHQEENMLKKIEKQGTALPEESTEDAEKANRAELSEWPGATCAKILLAPVDHCHI
jgi:hypothetical protein